MKSCYSPGSRIDSIGILISWNESAFLLQFLKVWVWNRFPSRASSPETSVIDRHCHPGGRLQTIAWFSNKKQKTFWPDRVWTNIDQFIAMRLCKSCMTDAKWSAKKIDVFFIPSFSLNWIESSNWLKGRLLFVMILTWFLLPWNSA